MNPKNIKIALIIVLSGTFFNLPGWYSLFADIFSAAVFIYITYLEIKERDWKWAWLYPILAIFYNPLLPIPVPRLIRDEITLFAIVNIILNMLWWKYTEEERKKDKEEKTKEITTFMN